MMDSPAAWMDIERAASLIQATKDGGIWTDVIQTCHKISINDQKNQ